MGTLGLALGLWACLLATSAPQTQGAVTLATGVTTGGGHTCAVTDAGSAKCWGWNYYGQLGVGTVAGPQICGLGHEEYPIGCSTIPVTVNGLGSGVKAIDAGYAHTCALTSAGGVKCWGYNGNGHLGNGTSTGPEECGQGFTPCSTNPVAVNGLGSGVTAIAAGWNHTCALTSAGGVKCWGVNFDGRLGDGTTTHRSAPVSVQLPEGVTATAIAAGGVHTCALTNTGGVECWGMNRFGQLGTGTDIGPQKCGAKEEACSTIPVSVQLPDGVTATAIAIGDESTCVVTNTGGVECWGYNNNGQLGDGTTTDSTTPVAVQLPDGVTATAISGFTDYYCALTSTGGIACWGHNNSGQLGDWTTTDSSTPVTVKGLGSAATAIAAGWDHTCALTSIGGVECWGSNNLGVLGNGDVQFRRSPTPVSGLSGARTLSVLVTGAGTGAITSNPPGIDCGAGHTSCSASFAAGSTVQLHASAEAGSAFSAFAGEGCGKGGMACSVAMSSDRSATAKFALPPLASIATPAGGGTYMLDEMVPTSFSCLENESGPGLTSCNDSNSLKTASGGGGKLDTSTLGFHAYTVTAVSKDGLADSVSIGYRVISSSTPEPNPKPGPPAPVPPKPEPATLKISIRSGSTSIRQGRMGVRLGCAGGTAASVCRGRLLLRIPMPVTRGRPQVPAKSTTLAQARYAIPTGERKLISVQLQESPLALLERANRDEFRAEAIATVDGGRTASRAIVLRLAKR